MRRPHTLLKITVVCCLLIIAAQYAALTWLAPQYVMRLMEHALGGQIVAAKAWWSFPSTMTLTGVRLTGNHPGAALSIQRATMKLKGVSLTRRTVKFEMVDIERPFMQITRTKSGVNGPAVSWSVAPHSATLLPASSARQSPWQIVITSLQIEDGTLEFLDERPAVPFHGLLDHLSLVIGPITIPQALGTQVSFAIRGELIGDQGHAAPAYCSGWLGLASQDIEASCQLEPLSLAAFQPYYQGPAEVRVYATTLRSTSQWSSRANDMKSRIQLELGNLTEGDLSIRGRTVIDVKKLTAGQPQPRLSGEVVLTGPFNRPSSWHSTLIPGDEPVQHLLKRLLDRGVEVLKVPFFGGRMRMSISPASQAVMTDIEAASREVQEALEILTVPVTEPEPEVVAEPAPVEPAVPTNGKGIMPPAESAPVTTAPVTQSPASPTPQTVPNQVR